MHAWERRRTRDRDAGIREGAAAQADNRGRPVRGRTHVAPCSGSSTSCTAIRPGAADRAACARSSSSASPRGERFFSAYTLTLILQQVAVVGILGRRPDARGPDRRHRPVGRRHHGALPSSSWATWRSATACRRSIAAARGLRRRPASAAASTASWSRGCRLPPFIVTLGTWKIVMAHLPDLLGQRDDPQAGRRRRTRRCSTSSASASRSAARSSRSASWRCCCSTSRCLVHAQLHRLGPPRLCRRRRSRRGRACRHPHRARC